MNDKIICVSGGCDPLHVGIVNLINSAVQFGKVIFILNNDEWVRSKKGFLFMPATDRKEILMNMKNVHDVIMSSDIDGSVNKALKEIMPDFFGHGDKEYNIPEKKLCEELGIKLIWELGGPKIESSTNLVDCMINSILDSIDKKMRW